MMVDLVAAVDLRGGRAVRLAQGEATRVTDYGDPLAWAERWAREGADWLHLVDLDAAFGDGHQREVIAAIVRAVACPVQVGGGVRREEVAEALWGLGVRRVVVGTAALERPELVAWAVRTAGPDRVAVALDARGLRLAVRGWRAEAEAYLLDVAPRFVDLGVRTFVYTDIERDGMLVGPNLVLAERLADASGADVIVSGGVASADDVAAVAQLARRQRRVRGVILGRALYDGRIDLSALRAWRDTDAPAA